MGRNPHSHHSKIQWNYFTEKWKLFHWLHTTVGLYTASRPLIVYIFHRHVRLRSSRKYLTCFWGTEVWIDSIPVSSWDQSNFTTLRSLKSFTSCLLLITMFRLIWPVESALISINVFVITAECDSSVFLYLWDFPEAVSVSEWRWRAALLHCAALQYGRLPCTCSSLAAIQPRLSFNLAA